MVIAVIALGTLRCGLILDRETADERCQRLAVECRHSCSSVLAVYRFTGNITSIDEQVVVGPTSAADALLYLSVIACGIALQLHSQQRDAFSGRLRARSRALFLLALAGGSVLLWHGLRTIEWHNLQAELRHVLARDTNSQPFATAVNARS